MTKKKVHPPEKRKIDQKYKRALKEADALIKKLTALEDILVLMRGKNHA